VNLLLLQPGELAADGTATLAGRRAEHIRTVLGTQPGGFLRCGQLDGGLGRAEVLRIDADQVVVRAELGEPPPPPTGDVLLLAVPRPKVLLRMLAHAAALGFERIVLFRSWRVERSHLTSRALEPAQQHEQLVLGLEQAGRTRLPTVRFEPLFKPMVEDSLPTLGLPAQRFVAHPTAERPTSRLDLDARPFALALGPDGGFLPYEVDLLGSQGFAAISCGPHPLRTETALAALWGQLDLLRERCRFRA
jgi:16S rRNA (uracil1498-N3)-methyltransferase